MVILVSKSSTDPREHRQEVNNDKRYSMERQKRFDETDYLHEEHGEGENTHDDVSCNKEFIRKLANDYIHFKIYGRDKTLPSVDNPSNLENTKQRLAKSNEDLDKKAFCKTAKTLRKVSMELENSNSDFFEKVCTNLQLQSSNAEKTFKLVSEEVLCQDSLNWGRVVSLFTFGGKLAEWFWETHQEDKVEEVEDWLTESLSGKEDWIEQNGGWDEFNKIFAHNTPKETGYNWLKPGLFICLGVSLAAVLTMTSSKP